MSEDILAVERGAATRRRRLERSVREYLQSLDGHVEEARQSVRSALGRAVELRKASEAESMAERAAQAARRKFLEETDAELSGLWGWEGHGAKG